jgi:hypothetical protein
MANVVIDIATEFTGKKGFKQAETATDKLTKNVKNLARNFGLAFGTAAVLNYAKTSIKAAADDQKAQKQLALALENVGLARDVTSTEQYIARLQSEFGILDDLLRPAYQRLAVATQNSAESQRLLNLALDISASTGKDVNAVTTALSRAYLGNNTALTRLGVGLSKADLKSKSFEEITTQLADTFAGSATAAAQTFSGQLAILSTGAAEASEIIGTGLIDSLKLLSDGGSISNVVTDMKALATAISDTTTGIALFIKEVKAIPVLGSALGFLFEDIGTGIIFSKAGKERRERLAYNKNEHMSKQAQVKSDTKITKLGSQQLSNAKKLSATQKQIAADKKKQEVLDKAALVLAQGKKVFDEEGIQLAAAAQGKLTEEERTRLNLKTDIFNLEAAINEGNISAAVRLSNSMVANAQKLAALRTDMIGLNDIENPFTAWLETLKLMAMELAALANIAKTPPKLLGKGSTGAEIEAIIDEYLKLSPADQTILFGSPLLPKGSLPSTNSGTFMEGPEAARFYNQMSASGSMGGAGTVVNVNVTGSVTTERDLVAAITQGLYAQQASGTPVNYSTVY